MAPCSRPRPPSNEVSAPGTAGSSSEARAPPMGRTVPQPADHQAPTRQSILTALWQATVDVIMGVFEARGRGHDPRSRPAAPAATARSWYPCPPPKPHVGAGGWPPAHNPHRRRSPGDRGDTGEAERGASHGGGARGGDRQRHSGAWWSHEIRVATPGWVAGGQRRKKADRGGRNGAHYTHSTRGHLVAWLGPRQQSKGVPDGDSV